MEHDAIALISLKAKEICDSKVNPALDFIHKMEKCGMFSCIPYIFPVTMGALCSIRANVQQKIKFNPKFGSC